MKFEEIKIGLTLSGGGVRAAVFHLGILSRLSDEKLLEKVKMISTVSGGSLVTGMIYQANNNKWPSSIEYKEKCIPYVRKCLTENNLQLNAFLRYSLFWVPIMRGRAAIVADAMESSWSIKCMLNDIPTEPRWNINATSIESGKSWRFIPNKRMGDYILNYVEKPEMKLSEALCCSAAVPFLIGPLKLKTSHYKWLKYITDTKGKVIKKIEIKPSYKTIHLWDGGAYDNLGIEPLLKYNTGLKYREEFNYLIVSDASGTLHTKRRRWFEPARIIDVTMDQVRSLRARVLWDHFKSVKNSGSYLKIGESTETIHSNIKPPFSVNELTKTGIDEKDIINARDYPTTLWKMKSKHFDNLFKHGWEVANAAIVSRSPLLFKNQKFL